ncbi:uncharacterized protein LOC143908927 [Arctopsyche grandis]|uniref:uncharacterized protein LOC143908927 n=1 Tax=Arctopsyche grandis TaxID=121162 RepID=UPI00406DA3AE
MKNGKLLYQENMQSIWMCTILLSLVITIVLGNEDLGNCFGGNDSPCEKNRGIIEGEYHPCKVLKRFSTLPKRIFFHNGQLYLKLNDSVHSYDEESSEIVVSDFKIPRHWKTIELGENVFTGGAGKATVQLSEDGDDLNIVTTGEITFDLIDVYKDIIFILSYNFNKSNKDKSGSLYVINSKRLDLNANVILADKIEVYEEKYFGMAIDSSKALLYLIGMDERGGKLIAISLEKGDPCNIAKSNNMNESDNLVIEPIEKDNLLKAVTVLTNVLNEFITQNKSKDCLPKNNTLLYENISLKKQVENLERKLEVFKSSFGINSHPPTGYAPGQSRPSSGGSFGSSFGSSSGGGYPSSGHSGYSGGAVGGYSGSIGYGNNGYAGNFNRDVTPGISDGSPFLPSLSISPLLTQLLQYPLLIIPIQSELRHINNNFLLLQQRFEALESDYITCQQNIDILRFHLSNCNDTSNHPFDNENNLNITNY